MKSLVLAEKPSVARDIARVLKCGKKGNGYLEGNEYVVTWALGHLVTLAEPDAYDQKYSAWKLEDIPMLPNQFKLMVIKQTGKQFSAVKAQMIRNDVRELVIATDAGREGELVARWIMQMVNIKKPVKRLWISSVTDKAILEGFKRLKDGREYENLYASAAARAEADWIVGLNATRALTCKYNAQLSCGRVQTPTLEMVAKREEEIKHFKPQSFYGIVADAGGIRFTWTDSKTHEERIFDKDRRDEIIKDVRGKTARVTEATRNIKKTYAPGLYDLTTLQRDANRLFNFSAKETLSIIQKLYETHKVLTYPRTDSRYISSDMVDTIKERLRACSTGPYAAAVSRLLRSPVKANKSFVDDSKVTDHHAIIPTEESVSLGDLNDKERKIFDLVVRRFLSVLYPPYEYEQITVKIQAGKEQFYARGKNIISQGWREVYNHNDEDSDDEYENEGSAASNEMLSNMSKDKKINIDSVAFTNGQTKPPSPLTEGTLLAAMENPGKYISNDRKDLIKTLGETGGIGTVATRADIIEKLFNSFLIEKRDNYIYMTSKGRQLLDLVPEDLKSPALTARWEQKLSDISRGAVKKDTFVNEMKDYTKQIVNEIKNSSEEFRHNNITMSRCSVCGKFMLEVNGKKGSMLVCQDRECGNRTMISRTSNARCPNCHKKLEIFGEGEGQTFVCNCGYKEKLQAFKQRKEKEGDRVSQKDVSRYLNQQKDDKNINTALADALAKLKK